MKSFRPFVYQWDRNLPNAISIQIFQIKFMFDILSVYIRIYEFCWHSRFMIHRKDKAFFSKISKSFKTALWCIRCENVWYAYSIVWGLLQSIDVCFVYCNQYHRMKRRNWWHLHVLPRFYQLVRWNAYFNRI